MKVLLASIPLFFLALFLYFKLAGPIPFSGKSVITAKTDVFSVSGEGKVYITPDIAIVNVGVEYQGPNIKEVQKQMNTTINDISEAIKGLGIDSKNIKTMGYNIYPRYDYSDGKQRLNGYQANSSLTIKSADLDKINQIIDTAAAHGATRVSGISFDIADREKAENEARKLAVEEAKNKARQAAAIAGFKLGKIVNYSEDFGNNIRPYSKSLESNVAADMSKTQIEPGSQEVQINVTLSYSLE